MIHRYSRRPERDLRGVLKEVGLLGERGLGHVGVSPEEAPHWLGFCQFLYSSECLLNHLPSWESQRGERGGKRAGEKAGKPGKCARHSETSY